jgi:hypothetical protein
MTPPNKQSAAPSPGDEPSISNRIQNVTAVDTKTEIEESHLLSLPIEELRKQGDRGLNPKITLFKDTILEGQLPDMQALRGTPIGEVPEDIASKLINSAVDNSAL